MSKAVGYPILVTNFENGKVTEEYRVDGNKILYEKYDYSLKDTVGYYCINFVPTGICPVLGEEEDGLLHGAGRSSGSGFVGTRFSAF